MKTSCFVILTVVVFLYGCSSGEKKNSLKKENLEGVWLVTNLYKTDKDISDFQGLSLNSIDSGNEVLNIYRFNGDNTFLLDTGSAVILKGNYSIEDTVISLKGDAGYIAKRYYTAKDISDSSMYWVTDFPNDNKGKLAYAFVKINTKDKKDLTNPEWKKPLDSAASDGDIKNKLVAILQHYENFYTALNSSGGKVFSQSKLLLPLTLYAGAVGTKDLSQTPAGFTHIMGSKGNAEKALLKLRNAFSVKFDYPQSENFAVGYIAVFHHLAQNIR